jgi:periplasmic divalent cation tolerance protein
MIDTGLVVIFVTVSNDEEARKISGLLLERRKVACVNIVSGVNSTFWWQGNIDAEQENLLIIKTKSSVLPEIVNLIKSVHSYEVPEIIAMPIIGGNEDYLKWIDTEVSK